MGSSRVEVRYKKKSLKYTSFISSEKPMSFWYVNIYFFHPVVKKKKSRILKDARGSPVHLLLQPRKEHFSQSWFFLTE